MGDLSIEGMRIGIPNTHPGTLIIPGRQGLQADDAAHGIAPEQGALRAPEHRNAHQVTHSAIKHVFVENRQPINQHTHDRLIHPGAHSPDIGGRCHARPVIGQVKIGHHNAHILEHMELLVK